MKDERKNKTNITAKHKATEEEKQRAMRIIGFVAGILSKICLEAGGCVVDYKINGENITDIEKLHKLDISERLKLAVKEERFEDAMNLKKILDGMNKNQKTLPNNEVC